MAFIANFIRFPAVQTFWKSLKIWHSYREFNGGNFYESQYVIIFNLIHIITIVIIKIKKMKRQHEVRMQEKLK